MPEPEEPRSGDETRTQQQLIIFYRDPKKHSYIDSSVSINYLFNKKLFSGLVKIYKTFKIQNGDDPIHLPQIRSQQHLMLPTSTYHCNENTTLNVSPVARLVNEYYTIYNVRDDNAIFV